MTVNDTPDPAESVEKRTLGGKKGTADGQSAKEADGAERKETSALDGSKAKRNREPTDMTAYNQARPKKVRGVPGWNSIEKAEARRIGFDDDDGTDDGQGHTRTYVPRARTYNDTQVDENNPVQIPNGDLVPDVDSFGNVTYHTPARPKGTKDEQQDQVSQQRKEQNEKKQDEKKQDEKKQDEIDPNKGYVRQEQQQQKVQQPKEVTWRGTHPRLTKFLNTSGSNAPAVFGIAGNITDTAARAFKLLSTLVTGTLRNPRNMMGNFLNTMEGAHTIADNSIENVRNTLGLPADANGEIMTDAVGTIKGAKYIRDKEQMQEVQNRYNQNIMAALEKATGTSGMTPEQAAKELPIRMENMTDEQRIAFADEFNRLAEDHLKEFLAAGVRTPAADAAMRMYTSTVNAQRRMLSGTMRNRQDRINRRTQFNREQRNWLDQAMGHDAEFAERLKKDWLEGKDLQYKDLQYNNLNGWDMNVQLEKRRLLHEVFGDKIYDFIDEDGELTVKAGRLTDETLRQLADRYDAIKEQQRNASGKAQPLTAEQQAVVDLYENFSQYRLEVNDTKAERTRLTRISDGIKQIGGDPAVLNGDMDIAHNKDLSELERSYAASYASNNFFQGVHTDDFGMHTRRDTLNTLLGNAAVRCAEYRDNGLLKKANFNKLSDKDKALVILNTNTYLAAKNRKDVSAMIGRIENSNLTDNEKAALINSLNKAYTSDMNGRVLRRDNLNSLDFNAMPDNKLVSSALKGAQVKLDAARPKPAAKKKKKTGKKRP